VKYMCLIYGSEAAWESLPEDQLQAVYAEYGRLGEQYGDRIVHGAELQPTATATSVRVRGGEALVTDGPFAETKEQLGGYFLIDADSLDDALEFAAKIPSARDGTVEVRPIVDRGS
jgi:hypothetical protein